MKVFFVALLLMVPLYIWYKVIMKIDRVFFDGRVKKSTLVPLLTAISVFEIPKSIATFISFVEY